MRFFHYTSFEAALSMFKRQRPSPDLRLTHILYLNDAREFRFGLDAALEAARRSNPDDLPYEGQKEALRRVQRDGVDHLLESPNSLAYGPFVACFTTAEDDLSQWRGYGSRGGDVGCSIGFEPSVPLTAVRYQTEEDCIFLMEQALGLLRTLPPEGEDWAPERWIKQFIDDIFKFAPTVKDLSFSAEQEHRMIVRSDVSGLTSGDASKIDDISFRPSRFGLTPYMTWQLADDILPIRSLMVGPTPHASLARRAVEQWAAGTFNGHPVEVRSTATPYRDW